MQLAVTNIIGTYGFTLSTYGYGQNPYSKLDEDCATLKQAMKGLGTDELSVINVLCTKPNLHRFMLRQRYSQLYSKDLMTELESELSGNLLKTCQYLLYSPYELDCKSLYEGMHRLGTDENTLIEIIATCPSYQLNEDKILFKQLYDIDLIEYVKKETSGLFRDILAAMLECKRHTNNQTINLPELEGEAKLLYEAGAKKLGTNEETFTRIFTTYSQIEMTKISEYYEKIAGVDLYSTLKSEFSGDAERLLKAILYASINEPEYYARRIRNAIKGLGTDDSALIRLIVSRKDLDLKLAKTYYQKIFGSDMVSDVRSDLSGDYKTIITKLLTSC